MFALRASLLRFNPQGQAIFDTDGLLVIDDAKIKAAGSYDHLKETWGHVPTRHLQGRVIAPGFVDMHVHYPQLDIIGSPADGLLPWLERYTFVAEQRFADPAHAHEVANFFLQELLRYGVTTALVFATSHPTSVDAFFTACQAKGLRMICGKVLQDQNSPPGLQDDTHQGLQDTEALIQKWHNRGRLGYAITPRFVPTSSTTQLQGAGALAARYPDTWIQSHVSENRDEVKWVADLHPKARSYLDVYDQMGLLRQRAIYAHCIWLDDIDRQRMHATGTAAAVSPTSNLFLGSGFFDYRKAQESGMLHGLASDVGGGTTFNPFQTMLAGFYAARETLSKQGITLAPENLWYQHTAGAAKALGLEGVIGNLAQGCEADYIILNPSATPYLARRTAQAATLAEWMMAMMVLADDRAVENTIIAHGAKTA